MRAGRLIATGVPADLHHSAGTARGFDVLPTGLYREARGNRTTAGRWAPRVR
ncbi:hypothetical protein KZZ52_34905 [Dactylosporangium sp. AC04546]|uniref:hypothetical protein n=1 Tax=Dactylosporangium sp. AC04546 TaxID=2862460 RepID=UPI001EE041A3|nr:hypothetical protein [Dactylosporangium sp. AC04546]WVK79160.1 hypothetical protein KZZ52_34905 [Dactylosporangium sp. AC04546]